MFHNIIFEIAFIFAGSAIMATLFLFLKQPVILAYIVLGMIIGPGGLKIIEQADHLEKISHFGIILLMYLLGLHLHPQKLLHLLKKTTLITLGTCIFFAAVFMMVPLIFGFSVLDSLLIGLALMFSSTVVSLKLIPTTTLHQKHMGEVMISILLMQDIIAIILLVILYAGQESAILLTTLFLLLKTLGLIIGSVLIVRWVILKLFHKFDVIQDYIFLVSLGWCLLGAETAHWLGLSYEIGAFVAGVSLGTSQVANVIAEGLKPLREFFLILFFFAIGAQFDFFVTKDIILPGVILAVLIIILKPLVFKLAFRFSRESRILSGELGLRLGQASEFSILIAYSATVAGKINPQASFLIQLTTILTFVISTYLIVYKFPTPIAVSPTLRKD